MTRTTLSKARKSQANREYSFSLTSSWQLLQKQFVTCPNLGKSMQKSSAKESQCFQRAARLQWCIDHTSSTCSISTNCAAYASDDWDMQIPLRRWPRRVMCRMMSPAPYLILAVFLPKLNHPSTAPSGRISPISAGRCDMIEASTNIMMLPGFLASRDESSGY